MTDVAIVGAGPYGLSIAAHLGAHGVKHRIFGVPMEAWSDHMPAGMWLKSDGFASNLSDLAGVRTLEAYCTEHGVAYEADTPVPRTVFVDYGLDFQRAAVPNLERRTVVSVGHAAGGFELKLDDGETLSARSVVLAVGIRHFTYLPPALRDLPPQFVSHSYGHKTFGAFKGKRVAVIGAGASATQVAASLDEDGASPHLVTTSDSVRFFSAPDGAPSPWWRKLRHPRSGLGPGLRSRFFSDFPNLFRYFPPSLRVQIVRRHLGPASAWRLKDRVTNRVPQTLGVTLEAARATANGVELTLRRKNGDLTTLEVDHVVAATGYQTQVDRLNFLSAELRLGMRRLAGSPELSGDFETSVKDLYIIGSAAAVSFGPAMRFVFGADFTARRLGARLARDFR